MLEGDGGVAGRGGVEMKEFVGVTWLDWQD